MPKYFWDLSVFSALPEWFYLGPERFLGTPERFSLGTERFSAVPERFYLGPERFSALPERFYLGPEHFSALPERFYLGTEPFLGTPEQFYLGTERFSTIPTIPDCGSSLNPCTFQEHLSPGTVQCLMTPDRNLPELYTARWKRLSSYLFYADYIPPVYIVNMNN